MKHYRAPNKRIIHRAGSGKFRKGTLADIGMAVCHKCKSIFTPDLSRFQDGFIDPRALRGTQELCPECTLTPAPATGLSTGPDADKGGIR